MAREGIGRLFGWSAWGGRWARTCQDPVTAAWEGPPDGSVTCSHTAGSAPGLLSLFHLLLSAGAESHPGEEDCRTKGPGTEPQGKLHVPDLYSCQLCPSPAQRPQLLCAGGSGIWSPFLHITPFLTALQGLAGS